MFLLKHLKKKSKEIFKNRSRRYKRPLQPEYVCINIVVSDVQLYLVCMTYPWTFLPACQPTYPRGSRRTGFALRRWGWGENLASQAPTSDILMCSGSQQLVIKLPSKNTPQHQAGSKEKVIQSPRTNWDFNQFLEELFKNL